jgi:hypothetical protein
MTGPCELCDAARLTPWYHEDDECWIAECEACFVPMVVWRVHDPHPDEATRARLLAKLAAIAEVMYPDGHVVDDRLRTIADHYHAHARPRRPWG